MKYLFASLLICLSVSAHAQQNHFIYIQADNRQPFYIKLDKKILSSSASGYLIIPKLQDSSYELSIGFPKNEWPEQKVTCIINRKDVGYLLKNFGEKGWGLFNFQTMDLLMAEVRSDVDSSKAIATTNDPFSTTLADVVNNPSIKTVEEVKEDTIAVVAPVKKAPAKKDVKTPAKGKALVVNKPRDRISKLLSRRNADSLRMVYVDRVNGVGDTVNIVIPIEKPVAKVVPPRKVASPKVDTAAKLIVSNKRPAKKPKADLAKANKKITDKAKDSVAVASTEVKAGEPKVDIVLENGNPISSNDTASASQPAKKLVDILAEMARIDKKVNGVAKDSTINSTPEVKIIETKDDVALENKDSIVVVVDTTVTVYSLVNDDTRNPTIDSLLNTKAENKPDSSKEIVKEPVIQPVDTLATVSADKPDVKKVETIVPDKKPAEPIVEVKPKEEIAPKTISAAPVYACKYVADGDEFMSLRKKMLKGKSDNEMLFIAHQLFLKRCVTTKQVERLSVLFTNDLAKYNLFDDAYHYTVDLDIFPTLQSQLTDEYYIKRFKAMLRQ